MGKGGAPEVLTFTLPLLLGLFANAVLADEKRNRIMGACPPEQTTTLQLIRSFIRYASAHRSELPGNAAVVVFRALREAYPCHAEHGE
jgi:Rap1a immunity proteins